MSRFLRLASVRRPFWFILDALPIMALGWVLLHLILLFQYGSVTITEQNKTILSAEILIVLAGLAKALTVAANLYRQFEDQQQGRSVKVS